VTSALWGGVGAGDYEDVRLGVALAGAQARPSAQLGPRCWWPLSCRATGWLRRTHASRARPSRHERVGAAREGWPERAPMSGGARWAAASVLLLGTAVAVVAANGGAAARLTASPPASTATVRGDCEHVPLLRSGATDRSGHSPPGRGRRDRTLPRFPRSGCEDSSGSARAQRERATTAAGRPGYHVGPGDV